MQIPVYKDLSEYEPKSVGPFTLRQAACTLVAAPVLWFGYRFLKPITGGETGLFVSFILAIPVLFFGWVKPYGMKPERFVGIYIKQRVLSPAKRTYKSDSFVERSLADIYKDKSKAKTKNIKEGIS